MSDHNGSRIQGYKRNSYTNIDNATINDKNLDWDNLGLLTYLLSKPDGWHISDRHLASERKSGRTRIQRMLGDLEDFGYIYRKKQRDPDTGQFVYISEIFESIDLNYHLNEENVTVARLSSHGSTSHGKPNHIVTTNRVTTERVKKKKKDPSINTTTLDARPKNPEVAIAPVVVEDRPVLVKSADLETPPPTLELTNQLTPLLARSGNLGGGSAAAPYIKTTSKTTIPQVEEILDAEILPPAAPDRSNCEESATDANLIDCRVLLPQAEEIVPQIVQPVEVAIAANDRWRQPGRCLSTIELTQLTQQLIETYNRLKPIDWGKCRSNGSNYTRYLRQIIDRYAIDNLEIEVLIADWEAAIKAVGIDPWIAKNLDTKNILYFLSNGAAQRIGYRANQWREASDEIKLDYAKSIQDQPIPHPVTGELLVGNYKIDYLDNLKSRFQMSDSSRYKLKQQLPAIDWLTQYAPELIPYLD